MAGEPIAVTNRFEFQQQVLKFPDPVAVNFTGANDRSKKLDRTFAALAREYAGRVKFVTVDTTLSDLLVVDYVVKPENTPTVILFLSGQPFKRWGNEQNPQAYRDAFEEVLALVWGRR